ncbi:sigma-70 family RNA polymerase sigma factor [Staphylococcus petrasii]|uniref:sigma-70 family RNA polymerase sigma factor n=1 Tax=Staphylococcus petrasii TaxID=1276936 RepID=UPI001F592714|nr:sigma-70 family RNA polymerase sigma factor [Staphylococcus petrasii]MCI2773903.1 sigma-70 family RNA polymerase sigma factor [Staphylococcus petrasii]
MNSEIELLEFLKSYSNENILNLNFEELLRLFNEENIPISNYLYGKIFLDKQKGIKFINKIGLYFPEQKNLESFNGSKSSNKTSGSTINKKNINDLINSDDDFFDDITDSEEFKNIENVDLLTKIDTFKFNDTYFERLQNDNDNIEIIAQIVNANQQLVRKIASRYQKSVTGSILDYDDLVSSGNIGLLKAIKKFDVTLGYQFSTYATWWIKQNITRDIADRKLTIRLPVHLIETLNKLNSLLKEHEDSPKEKLEEICIKEMSISKEKLYELLKIDYMFNKSLASLHTSIGQEKETTLGEMINYDQNIYNDEIVTPEELVTRKIFREEMEQYFKSTLKEKEIDVLKRRNSWNGESETLEEIGTTYNVTRERIRQIEAKAINKLRKKLEKEGIHKYLDEL